MSFADKILDIEKQLLELKNQYEELERQLKEKEAYIDAIRIWGEEWKHCKQYQTL